MGYLWTVTLPDFDNDNELVNPSILEAVLQEWYEEANPI